MPEASRTRFSNLVVGAGKLTFAAALLGTVALPPIACAQGVYVPDDSRAQGSSQGAPANADNPTVKSLGTLPIDPGGEPTHPYISDDDIDSGGLNANHVAYGEAAANAYKAKNFSEARALWEQAAKDGDIDALYALGVMNERGEGGPKDLEQALGWYSAAQQKGVRQASAKVTAITEQLRQEAAAAEAANKAAEAAQDAADKAPAQNAPKSQAAKTKADTDAPPPSPPPQVTRETGPPTPPSQTIVEPQANKAPTQLQPKPPAETVAADPNAMQFSPAHSDIDIPAEDAFARATAAAAGRGVAKNDTEAAKWFRVAADKGYAPAQNDLGFFYAEGRGVKKDDAEAVKWYQRAADQNYPPGQMSLGMMYAAGRGVKQSDFDALALYSSAANQGYAPATTNLAQAYAQGRGIQKDERTAAFLASSVNEKPRQGSGIYVDSGS